MQSVHQNPVLLLFVFVILKQWLNRMPARTHGGLLEVGEELQECWVSEGAARYPLKNVNTRFLVQRILRSLKPCRFRSSAANMIASEVSVCCHVK